MSLHFSRDEFAARQKRTCEKMAGLGLDGLLIFRQESMFYLTGYDTSGYTMFQGMYMTADGRLALLTRTADRLQSRMTSVLEDIRMWYDREGANPAEDLRELMRDYGAQGKTVGVEYHAYGLTAQRGKMVDAALDGFCTVVDGSDVVREVRLVKSPAELAFVRKAGEFCDAAWHVANTMTVPGEFLGSVYGEMLNIIMRGDGDPSAGLCGSARQCRGDAARSRRRCAPATPWASSTMPTVKSSTAPATATPNSPPAATRSASPTRRPGWTGR
jgi:Xaa-Pro dipeptidase